MAIINLQPSEKELRELSIQFNEGNRLFGYECEVLIPKNTESEYYGYTKTAAYDKADRFLAYISFVQNPSTKLLYSFGWNTDSEKPLIITIARYLQPIDKDRKVLGEAKEISPSTYTILHLNYDYNDLGKDFKVSKVVGSSLNPVYFNMSIVPYRELVHEERKEGENINSDNLNVIAPDDSLKFRFDEIIRENKKKLEESDSSSNSESSGFKFLNM